MADVEYRYVGQSKWRAAHGPWKRTWWPSPDERTNRAARPGLLAISLDAKPTPLPLLLFTSLPTPPCPPAWDAIRLRSAIRTDRSSLSVSNHLLCRFYPSLVFRFFFLSLPHEILYRVFRTYHDLYRRQ